MTTSHESTFRQYLADIESHSWDHLFTELTSDDFTLEVVPRSLKIPIQNKTAVRANFPKIFDAVHEKNAMKFTVDRVTETKQGLVAYAEANSTSKLGTPWHNEFVFVVDFNSDGKISKILEMLDGVSVMQFSKAEAEKSSNA